MNSAAIAGVALKLLDGALMVAEMKAEDRTRLQTGAGKLKAMLEADRDPTDEEWAEVNAISDAFLAEILARADHAG